MKRLLILALLSIPAASSAQGSFEWNTYCENGVELVRGTWTVRLGEDVYFDATTNATIAIFNEDQCVEGGYTAWAWATDYVNESLGDGVYRYVWDGFPRSGFLVEYPVFLGQYTFLVPNGPNGELIFHLAHFGCYDFEPIAITDNTDCVPLPVESTTWGAVKALYRSQGETP